MELASLRYFKMIAAEGHMTRAAERMGVTQPALSAAVRKLEEEVGTALLDRTGRGVRLTEAGRVFLEHAEASLLSADRAVAAVRALMGLEHGTVSIGGGATAIGCILPPVVRAFRAAHPAIRVHLREAGSVAIAEAVLNGTLDMGFVTQPMTIPGARDLMTVGELVDEMVLLVPAHGDGPGAALRKSKTFRWSDIAAEPVIGFEAGSAVRRVVDDAALKDGVVLNVVMELRSIEGIRRMVAEGIGIGFVSRFAIDDDAASGRGAVHVLGCKDARIGRVLAVVRRRDHMPSPAVEQFEKVLLRAFTQFKGRS